MRKQELFPDGTQIGEWFYDTKIPLLQQLGTQYILTDFGIKADGKIYTKEIQAVIDRAAENGGGVVVVPEGIYKTGALFFKQGVNLYVSKRGVLMGSDNISDYTLLDTRIEGENCKYFSALINVDGVDGFIMCGEGTIDGNGLNSWKAFWKRREWNPNCTNKDEQRPRLVHISNSSNVLVAQLNLQNSQFWTNHIYKSHHVKYIGCRVFSPASPVPAPSTDAVDIDVCTDVLIKNCYFEVNDDSVVLKGGKGPWADTDPNNGANERIIVEDCEYGFCHGCLTCGSESVHNRNIIVRRVKINKAGNLLWLKMRPDTPQKYEYITIEDIEGEFQHFIDINPWMQFFDLKGREDVPLSYAENITMRNCNCKCEVFFAVKPDTSQYILSDFVFENINVTAAVNGFDETAIENLKTMNLNVGE